MFGRLPSSSEQWWALVQLWFWGLLSWLLHPIIWIGFGPLKWMAMLGATAAQESTYNPSASGDNGRSIGILQFYDTTWSDLALGDLDRRYSLMWQGWAAGKYVQTAILYSFWWIPRFLVPYYVGGYCRLLWVNGIRGGLTRDFNDMVSYWDGEGAARPAWNTFRLISLFLMWPLMRILNVGFIGRRP